MSTTNLSAIPRPAGAVAVRYTFKVPPKARVGTSDPESVTLVPLTLEQEQQGNKLVAKSNNPFDKVKMSLVAVDGRPVDWASGEVDRVLDSFSPPVRNLIIAAYLKIHEPAAEDVEGFLSSMETSV